MRQRVLITPRAWSRGNSPGETILIETTGQRVGNAPRMQSCYQASHDGARAMKYVRAKPILLRAAQASVHHALPISMSTDYPWSFRAALSTKAHSAETACATASKLLQRVEESHLQIACAPGVQKLTHKVIATRARPARTEIS